MKKFIFDVDGTLTPSRGRIAPDFLPFFIDFISKNDVYLVTGSDRAKTLDQITPGIYNGCKRVYNCSGSDVYDGDVNVYRDEWELPDDVEKFLLDELDYSQFPIRNGNHIERRPGGVNFSILGRDKDPSIGREEWIKWDTERLERVSIADRLKNQFPDLEVQIGGQTGLDLAPKGMNKSQILNDFNEDDNIYFYGDMIGEGGNDHDIAKGVIEMKGKVYMVNSWKDTWDLLSVIHKGE